VITSCPTMPPRPNDLPTLTNTNEPSKLWQSHYSPRPRHFGLHLQQIISQALPMPHNNCNLHHILNTLKNPTPCCSSLTFLPEPLLKALLSIKRHHHHSLCLSFWCNSKLEIQLW
jgi:hypothetical protein